MANIDDDLKLKREQLKKEQNELKQKRSLLRQNNLEGRPFNSEQVTISKDELKNTFPNSLDKETVNNAKKILSDNLKENEIDYTNSFIENKSNDYKLEHMSEIDKEIYNNGEQLTKEQIEKINKKLEKKLTPSHNSSTNYNYNYSNSGYKSPLRIINFIIPMFMIGVIFFVTAKIFIQIKDTIVSETILLNEVSNVSTSMTNVISESFLNDTMPIIAIAIVLSIPILLILAAKNNLRNI